MRLLWSDIARSDIVSFLGWTQAQFGEPARLR